MTPGAYTLPAFTHGDTWDGVPTITITIDDAAPSTALSSVRMHFRTTAAQKGSPLLELTSAAGDITITSAANWIISIPAQSLDLPVGTLYYDIEFTDTAGTITTYLSGTITVAQDVTR